MGKLAKEIMPVRSDRYRQTCISTVEKLCLGQWDCLEEESGARASY